jgi:AraC-like DNA-binding protein
MPKQIAKPVSAEDVLRNAGIALKRIQDVPPKVVREVMRQTHTFHNMRSIELPEATIRASLKQALLCDLLVTRVGYCGPTAGHYIPRPEGSLDHILIHCVRGEGWLEMNGRRWTAGPDTVVCIPAEVPHTYGANEYNPWSIYWLHLAGANVPGLFRFLGIDGHNPLLYVPHGNEVLGAFEGVWAANNVVHTWENLVQGSLRASYYASLLQNLQRAPDPRNRAREDAIRQSLVFMQENLGAESSLVQLAELAGMSVTRYAVNFRKLTGCSPIEYFNRLKIQKACELLRFSQKSVAEIGEELGFADQYYFSHAFKKVTGLSPANFRRK